MAAGRRFEGMARQAFRRLPPGVQNLARRARDTPLAPQTLKKRGLLSVVMPVYNVESYLREAVESVLGQGYRNLELILVDDGSSDTSAAMCDEFARDDERVRVIHQENRGPAFSRNTGIAVARGEYLAFVDGDDYLLPGAYQAMVGSLRASGSDVVTANAQRRRGKRLLPARNQSRSHGTDRRAVTFAQHPDLVFDTVAWNKVFRTAFWHEHVHEFPAGKLYEDIVPMFKAFLAARSVDVLAHPVYVWRVRNEGDSLTQQLLDPRNISDRLEALAGVETLIGERGLDDVFAVRVRTKILDTDLWWHARGIADDTDPVAVELIESGVRRYWPSAPEASRAGLSPVQRIGYWLIEHGRSRELAAVQQWYEQVADAPPTQRVDGRLLLDVSTCPVQLAGLPPEHLDLGSIAVGVAHIARVDWVAPATLAIEGYAYIRFVSDGSQRIELIASGPGSTHTYPVQRSGSPAAALTAMDLASDHEHDGFRCEVDVAALRAGGADGEWSFQVRITDEQEVRTVSLDSILPDGLSTVVGTAVLADGCRASVLAEVGRPLRIVFDADGVPAESFAVSGTEVRLRLAEGVDELWLAGGRPEVIVHAEAAPDGAYLARLDAPTGDDKTQWRVRARRDRREVPVAAPPGLSSETTPNPSGLRAVADPFGRAAVQAAVRTAVCERIDCGPDGAIELGGVLYALAGLEVGIAATGGVPVQWYPAQATDGRFAARIPITDTDAFGATRPLPSGRYRVVGRSADGAAAAVLVADHAAAGLPRTQLRATAKIELGRSSRAGVVARLAAPVPDELLGPAAQNRLAQRYSAPDRVIEDAVFCYVDLGSNAGDSALAIHEELRRRAAPLTLYWGVADLSVAVPAGGVAVVRSSPEWYEKLNASRYVVDNYGAVPGLVKHREQRYLQTWHGTPYKFVGVSELRHRNASAARIDVVRSEAAEWDAFVSPSAYVTGLVRSEFDYAGPVLETGYPRNDRLASPDEEERHALRTAFGIPPEARVLLYAPTYREGQRHGSRAALYDGLDLQQLLSRLGEAWYVLLRGHSFNARDDRSDRSDGRLVDVTRHPDVNDLYLAADVLVTDYSSVMFDFAVTGRPIAYFTPDIDNFVATRGVYFDLAECAPGPMCTDVARLADELRDLHALAARYRRKYAMFRERFAPWDDGKAAARVVDAFFTTGD